MLQIEMCDNCAKKYERLRGPCPIWEEIQKGAETINDAMVMAQSESKPRIVGVISGGHWLADCKFDCDFFEATPA